MKKKLFRSLGRLLSNKRVVLPFLGLLTASAIFVWTTAFAPGGRESLDEQDTGGKDSAERKTSAGKKSSEEKKTSAGSKNAGLDISSSDDLRQCKAITKKGTRCLHMADESGYCMQHRRALFEQVPANESSHGGI